ncbi:MAG: hypothetical protein ACI4ST_08355, partial [Candidatus Gallimonas sp.]
MIAPAPSLYIPPRIQSALAATIKAEKKAGGKIRFMPFPASIRTGAARKAFIPAYTAPPVNPGFP